MSLHTPRFNFGKSVVQSKIYVIGGYISPGPTNLNEVYGPERDFWLTAEVMPTLRLWLAVAVVDDIIYAIGGATTWRDFIGHSYGINQLYTPL